MTKRDVVKRIETHIQVLQKQIESHEKDRKKYLKVKDDTTAAYHYGRISGMSTGITQMQCVIDFLKES